jgi:thioredoxin 1
MKQTQGFGAIGIVGLVALVLTVGAIAVTLNNNKMAGEKAMMAEKIQMEEKAMMEKKAMEEKAMMEKDGEMMKSEDEAMMKKDDAMKGEESMMEKDEAGAMMKKSGTYATYSVNSLPMAQKERTVLFFHAGWCPTCRSADADITAGAATIPAGVTILKTDYDKEVALKQKYGVTSQHTFVEVDANGTMIQKWSGGNLAGIIAKL